SARGQVVFYGGRGRGVPRHAGDLGAEPAHQAGQAADGPGEDAAVLEQGDLFRDRSARGEELLPVRGDLGHRTGGVGGGRRGRGCGRGRRGSGRGRGRRRTRRGARTA